METMLSSNRASGLAIVGGLAVLMGALLLYPGGWLVDATESMDFQATIDAMVENDNLSHAVFSAVIIACLAISYGILSFWRLSDGDPLLQFGILVNLFHYGIYILTMGMRHMLVAIAQHQDDIEVAGVPAGAEQINDYLVMLQASSGGLHYAFVIVSSVSGVILGLALARRFDTLNVYAAACWVFFLAGVAGLLNVFIGQQAEAAPEAFVIVSNLVLFVAAIALLVIGIGVTRSERELVPEM
ncbi:MAG: hypothetical protein F4X26_05965 [Chloroflexi bacterium]|nr:hypothetical protein [Chloroflexota bacterium]